MQQPRYVKLRELSVHSSYSERSLRELIHSGQLKFMRKSPGKKNSAYLIDLDDWERYIEKHRDCY